MAHGSPYLLNNRNIFSTFQGIFTFITVILSYFNYQGSQGDHFFLVHENDSDTVFK